MQVQGNRQSNISFIILSNFFSISVSSFLCCGKEEDAEREREWKREIDREREGEQH